jgi:hypothetical protein
VTALGAAGCQHKTAILGRHARAETVAALANQVRRLKGALHRGSPSDGARTTSGFEGLQLEARPLRAVAGQVNAAHAISCNISPGSDGQLFQSPFGGNFLINAA